MKRKLCAVLLCLGMMASLAACGNANNQNNNTPTAPQNSATAPAGADGGNDNQPTLAPQEPKNTAPDNVMPSNNP